MEQEQESSHRGTSETSLGQHWRDDGIVHPDEPSVKQLSPSEHNIVLSLPFLTSHFFHPFAYFFHFLTCSVPPPHRVSLCSACFQLDRREAGMKGWRKSSGAGGIVLHLWSTDGKRLNEGFEAGEGWQDRGMEERKAPEHLLRWGTW